MKNSIELNSVSKKYFLNNRQEIKAIDNISLEIQTNQIIGILGPNGAGKTTIIKMLCNLVNPTYGTIKLNGFDIIKDRKNAMKQIGVVLEGSRNVFWQLTALQNITYFGKLKGVCSKELANRAEKLLKEFEIWNLKDQTVNTFSRGNQQKISIICAVIADPSIILLDEPTLGLDIQSSKSLINWIKKLAKEENKTIILTTHQLDIVEEICQRIIFINKGQLISNKPTDELLQFFKQEQYQITIINNNSDLVNILPDMQITYKNQETILTGPITTQYELFNKISIIYNNSLPLVSINRIKYNIEDIFLFLSKQSN